MAFWEVTILHLQWVPKNCLLVWSEHPREIWFCLQRKEAGDGKQLQKKKLRRIGSYARCGPNNLLCSKLLCGYCGPGLRLVALIWRIRQRRPIAKLQEDLNRSRHHRRLHQNQIITLVTHSAHSNMLLAHFNVAVYWRNYQRQALLASMLQIRETDQKETMPFTHSYRWDPFQFWQATRVSHQEECLGAK